MNTDQNDLFSESEQEEILQSIESEEEFEESLLALIPEDIIGTIPNDDFNDELNSEIDDFFIASILDDDESSLETIGSIISSEDAMGAVELLDEEDFEQIIEEIQNGKVHS